MTAAAAVAEPLLGVDLPGDQPGDALRTARGLDEAAQRLAGLARGVAALLPVQRWAGVASVAADRRLLEIAMALTGERSRPLRAGEALTAFSRAVAEARRLGDEAVRLLEAARRVQAAADPRDPALALGRASGSWSGPRDDGTLYDPDALALLRRARSRAREARDTYDGAGRRLTGELTELSGRRVVRAGMSARSLLDLAGFVPVVGDAVDAVNAGVYVAQGRWGDALLTAAAVVPGPEGWVAGGAKIGKAVDHAGDIEKVVDDVPADVRATEVLTGLTVRGRRADTRLLPDDESIERFYRERLEPLGVTHVANGLGGDVWVTTLPSGARVTFRRFSGSGGYTVQMDGLDGLGFYKVHRPNG